MTRFHKVGDDGMADKERTSKQGYLTEEENSVRSQSRHSSDEAKTT